ncbi:60 kDa lysophospholipase isoform X3 [Homo sapiens]|uniref:60 kDa lysophospholipase isoform X3 n=1 Tax=Homo sapiens TaxID=9606 RepID=UPI0007DC610C|nr:60 kDa lysophospholipase isoform X3 [Homo sapiens]|eukprot:XP_016876756.1 60 kDa lysophospholipase isoform X3 [Homo sapiens]
MAGPSPPLRAGVGRRLLGVAHPDLRPCLCGELQVEGGPGPVPGMLRTCYVRSPWRRGPSSARGEQSGSGHLEQEEVQSGSLLFRLLLFLSRSPASRNQRILYTVLECQPLFDSSDMTIAEWVCLAQTIKRHYEQYHGFVVIHGTDTMAFAASMLSFMLENLQKTVILTGAQVPIHALWSDGRENLLGALLMAGQYVIPEVCLFFQNQLFRGNRATKVDARRFAAFCSPNLLPLATVGADITINRELVRKVDGKAGLVVHSSMEQDVGLLRLYPGIPAALVRAFLQPPLKGVVMETFGSGNGPTKPDLLQELRVATERGLVIVNCTHCLQGAVTTDYAAGMAMAGAGVISGFDMTSEAALAKLSYVLGQPGLSLDVRKELLTKDLRGEMTPPSVEERRPSLQGNTLGGGVSWLLSLSGSQEADALRNALVPSLACAAAHAGDVEALQALVELGSDLGLVDFNGQTPLHAAARGGHTEAVTMLLQRGVDVNTRDTDGFSPLLLAVRGRTRLTARPQPVSQPRSAARLPEAACLALLCLSGTPLSGCPAPTPTQGQSAGLIQCPLRLAEEVTTGCDQRLGVQWGRSAHASGCHWVAAGSRGLPVHPGAGGSRDGAVQAEAAGNLAVVAFLQSLEGAVGAQAPCPEVLPGV